MSLPNPDKPHPLVGAVRSFVDHAQPWVLFEHGTVVIVPPNVDDPVGYATVCLRTDAEQIAGSAAGDFAVNALPDESGYAVSSHDPRVFTVVPSAQVGDAANDVTIGAAGRAAHGADAAGGRAVFFERATPA